MTIRYERTIAYICPKCTEISVSYINIFTFSGNPSLKLHCDDDTCKTPCVSIHLSKDKYVIDISCPICGENHRHTISKTAFWNKDLISFACPNTIDADIIFIGEDASVLKACDELYAEHDDDLPDEYVLYELVEHINNMIYNNKIHCKCGSHTILPTLEDDALTLICDNCDSKISFNLTQSDVFEILKSHELFIK